MNKRLLFIELGIFIIVVIILISLGAIKKNNTTNANSSDETNNKTEVINAEKIQVFMFHSTQRCVTCIAIGKLANETVQEYFSSELTNGKIEFQEINIDLPENKELAQKFQASGSSLFINPIYNNQDHISQDTNIWRLTSNPNQFKSYLKSKLEKYSFN